MANNAARMLTFQVSGRPRTRASDKTRQDKHCQGQGHEQGQDQGMPANAAGHLA